MVVNPVLASLSTSSILVARGTVCFSFCSPSRGPTSTMRTWSARLLGLKQMFFVGTGDALRDAPNGDSGISRSWR